jgi:hypothetical protein
MHFSEIDFRWISRKLNGGDRTAPAVLGAQGKRLPYRAITQ